MALVAVIVLFVAPESPSARAVTSSSVSIQENRVRIGGTVAVSVTDPGASTPAVYTAEAAGKTAYSLPVALSGSMFIFQTAHPLVADRDADGLVSASDMTISVPDAIVVSVISVNGVFTVQLRNDVLAPKPFTLTYNAERIDTLAVKVSSSSDAVGFDLTLQETAADSGVFSGTFETGAATVTTNATVPAATARPDIKAVHNDFVTVNYTDTEPLSLVSDTILVDGVKPTVTVLSPAHNAFEQTFSSFLTARISDGDSGVDVNSIRFHLDSDGNNTFTEPGTIILPDNTMTTTEASGIVVRALIPSAADGLRTWYVTASDTVGNGGRSDADAVTAGDQVHIFTSDQNPPFVASVIAGEWYDTVAKTVKTGLATSVRVVFSEKISVPSIVASGFRVNDTPAMSASTYAVLPNDIFLTVIKNPAPGPATLTVVTGSVSDLSGLKTSPIPVTITDKIAPVLKIDVDRPATNSLIKIGVESDELLASPPSITVNGLTRGTPTKVAEKRWELDFDVATLTDLDAGQGVKTVSATGFDVTSNLGTAPAVTFQVDSMVAPPALTPTGSVSDSFPDIIASYAAELGEYPGDNLAGMSVTRATLDGEPVASLMTTADGGVTWKLSAAGVKPDGYEKGVHVFEITAVDDAGNAHGIATTVFQIDVDPPVPAPVEESPAIVPEPEEEAPAVETAVVVPPDVDPTDPAPVDVVVDDATTPGTTIEEDLAAGPEDVLPPDEAPPRLDAPVEAVDNPEDRPDDAIETLEEPPVAVAEPAEVAGVAPDAGPAEIVEDPSFDREAEQAALDAAEAESGEHASSTAEEAGGTIMGCNVPLGSSGAIGGEYALFGIGLIGLGARRPVGALRSLLWPARYGA